MSKMKVYVVNTGNLKNDINMTYALSVVGTRSNPYPTVQWLTVPTWCALIDHPTAGWILYDIGSHPDSNSIWPESVTETCYYEPVPGATIEEQFALLGLKPEDVKHIIMSHMHMDHIGNLQLFKDTAEFYVSRAEAANAFTMVCNSPDPTTHGFYNKKDVLTEVKKLHYIEEDCELFPGIEAIILPGHTPGVMGLVIHLEEDTIILTSDAINGQKNYDGCLPGVCADTVAFRNSLKKLKALEKQYNATVWFAHDIDQFNTLKKIPEYYA